jgi:hypothetical protein
MLEGEGDAFRFQTRTPNSKSHEGDFANRTSDVGKIISWTTRMSYKNDKGLKAHGHRRRHTTMTRKSQSLLIFITSFFTTTPLAINCSSIICHSTSSILIKGEYKPSLKDYLITSGSSSKAPTSTANKVELPTNSADFHP